MKACPDAMLLRCRQIIRAYIEEVVGPLHIEPIRPRDRLHAAPHSARSAFTFSVVSVDDLRP